MKWFRIILPIFLSVGMILCIGSVAYADPDLDVDIDIVGDDADVGVDIYGDNAEVWINGQNLNEPTAVYNILGGGGVDGGWVNRRISEALAPLQFLAEGQVAGLNLTAEGLAKVIVLAQSNESMLGTLVFLFDEHGNRLTDLESLTAYLGEQADALDAQITAEINHLTDSHNRTLAIIIGAFSLVVIGLAAGLVLLWRRH
ncbi:hypothetical protein ES703_89430 [subsurface metagenome]